MDRLEEHARVLRAGEEDRSQLDLTFPEAEAAKALHDVAAAACACLPASRRAVHPRGGSGGDAVSGRLAS